jgi:hypothetical protein
LYRQRHAKFHYFGNWQKVLLALIQEQMLENLPHPQKKVANILRDRQAVQRE